jgi:hypothetical protein
VQRTEPDRTPSSTQKLIPSTSTLEQTSHYSAVASDAHSLQIKSSTSKYPMSFISHRDQVAASSDENALAASVRANRSGRLGEKDRNGFKCRRDIARLPQHGAHVGPLHRAPMHGCWPRTSVESRVRLRVGWRVGRTWSVVLAWRVARSWSAWRVGRRVSAL